MNKAFVFRIYPTKEQQVLFNNTFGCCRFIYNKMLADKKAYYDANGKTLHTTPAQYKSDYPWLKEVDSLALCNVQLHLQSAYAMFFKKQTEFPKFKSKKDNKNNSYTTNNLNNSIRIENNKLRLPKVGLVKIKMHRNIPNDYELKSVTIKKMPSGKYYASILFEYEQVVEPVLPQSFLGLDFAMGELYIDSDNNKPLYPTFYRQSEKRLAKEQRILSKMKKGSNNYKKQKLKVALIHEHVANQRKDFLHKQSRQIANAFDCVCIEDLNMQSLSKALRFGKSVHDNGWGMFTNMLSYKLTELGKQLIKIDKYYPSSQLCSHCGYQNPAVKDLSIRQWTCPQCGTTHIRDYNAAVNIMNEGKRLAAV